MLKNHKDITTLLLNWKEEGEHADVNGTDEEGKTILSYAVQNINEDTLRFIKFLIKDKVKIADYLYLGSATKQSRPEEQNANLLLDRS